MKKLMYLMGFWGAVTLTGGITFKLLRFPYGTELFTIGFLLLLLVFIPLYAFERYQAAAAKESTYKMKIILGLAAAIITGLSGLFKILHLQGAEVLLLVGAIIFVLGFLPIFFFTLYKKSVS